MLQEINDLIDPVAMNPEIRVVILRGAGKVFSSGIDFNSLGELAGTFLGDVGALKKIIKRGEGVDLMTHLDMEASLQTIMIRSEDFQEGVNALIEGRDPQWKRK